MLEFSIMLLSIAIPTFVVWWLIRRRIKNDNNIGSSSDSNRYYL